MMADPDPVMLKRGLMMEIFAGYFLPRFNA